MEIVSAEVDDVNPRERMNFGSNSVSGKTPKFVDLGLSPPHTTDKLKSVIGPATISVGLADKSDWLVSRHRIAEVTGEIVSKVQAYRDYIKKSEFETRNVCERENIKLTRQDQNIPMT